MRKPVLLIFTNALILIVIFVLLAQSLFLVQRIAQAGEVKGKVEVARRGGDFSPLKSGQTVIVGDEVRTGQDGIAEFTWADKTRWRVMPNSRLTIKKAIVNSVKKAEISQFRLDAGKVFIRIVKSFAPGSSFEVETPTAVAAVRGTVFSVEVAGNQTKVGVYKGAVKVSDGAKNQSKTITPGQEALAGEAKIALGATDNAAFQSQPTLLKPSLEAQIKTRGDLIFLWGETETGDKVSINGQNAKVLNNGTFRKSLKLVAGYNEWKIASTDKHNAQNSACRAVNYDAKTRSVTETACR